MIKKDWISLKERISEENQKIRILKNNPSINKLINYLVSGEDHRFRYHIGFDIVAIMRAFRNRIVFRRLEGASTIEQQLVRTVLGSYEKTVRRKVKEVYFAFLLGLSFDKKTIALIYLDIAFYGSNYLGLESILQKFNLNKGDYISDEICAEIVSRLKYPEPVSMNYRFYQIQRRKKHLLKLYERHRRYKILKVHE